MKLIVEEDGRVGVAGNEFDSVANLRNRGGGAKIDSRVLGGESKGRYLP